MKNFKKEQNEILFEQRNTKTGNEFSFADGIKKLPIMVIMGAITTIDDYVEREDTKFAEQLERMAKNAPDYATKYGYSTDDLEEMVKDAATWRFYVKKHGDVPDYGKAWTEKGKQIRKGTGTAVSDWPHAPDVSTPPDDVPPGVERRYREKVQRAKSKKLIYLRNDGLAMGFEKEHSEFVPENGIPEPWNEFVEGGHPIIKYVIGKYEMMEILKDSGDGNGFVFLDKTIDPYFVDKSTLPAANKSAVWKYKMIYWFDGKRAGEWSKDLPVTVHGE